jgi:hypothetical protein
MAQGSLSAACMQAQEATAQLLEQEQRAAAAREEARDAEQGRLQAALRAAHAAHNTVRACLAQCGTLVTWLHVQIVCRCITAPEYGVYVPASLEHK